MILASCRLDRHKHRLFSLRWDFCHEADAADGPSMPWDAVMDAIAGRRLAMPVHGYRVEGGEPGSHPTVAACSQIAQQCLTIGFDEVLAVLWPSLDLRVEFPLAIHMAETAGRRLRGLLDRIERTGLAVRIVPITHSLGARVAMHCATSPLVKQMVLMGPALKEGDISNVAGADFLYEATSAQAPNIWVVKSANDPVLKFGFPTMTAAQALGCVGPVEPHGCYVIDADKYVEEHGGYRKSPEVWAAVKEALA